MRGRDLVPIKGRLPLAPALLRFAKKLPFPKYPEDDQVIVLGIFLALNTLS